MTPRVFTFWTGPQSPLIQLCLESIQRNCPESECWTLEQWRKAYDGRFGPWKRIRRQRPNLQSDILRAWLLSKWGGIWIDADCILFRDLRPLWEKLADHDLVTYRVPGVRVCTALMVAKPESKVMAEQCRIVKWKLGQHEQVPTLGLGPLAFANAIERCPTANVWYLPHKLIHPLPWWTRNKNRRVLRSDQEYPIAPDAYGFMLTHRHIESIPTWYSKQDLLRSKTPTGQALRVAFPEAQQ